RHVLLDRGPLRSQIGFAIRCNGGHGIYPSFRGQANAYLGHLGDVVEFTPHLVQWKRTSGVLSVVALYADPFLGYIRTFLKANQSASNRGSENGKEAGQCSCVAGVLGPLARDARSAVGRIHARSVRCFATHFGLSARMLHW